MVFQDVPMIQVEEPVDDEDTFMDGMYTDPHNGEEYIDQDIFMDVMPEASSSKRTRSPSVSTILQSPRMSLLSVKY